MSAAATDRPAAPARERILEAASDVIAQDGIDDVRIARIARIAGVSTALVHYHFSTRDALLEEAITHSFDRLAELRRLEGAEPGAAEQLAAMIEQSLPGPGAQDRDWSLWLELELRSLRRPELRPLTARMYGRYHSWFEGAVEAGVRTGEFAPCDPAAVADHVLALIDGMGLRTRLGDPRMPAARTRARICELIGRELGLPRDWLKN